MITGIGRVLILIILFFFAIVHLRLLHLLPRPGPVLDEREQRVSVVSRVIRDERVGTLLGILLLRSTAMAFLPRAKALLDRIDGRDRLYK